MPHQARHTLATNLLRAGASLTHIRTYLGQVSDRMAEHYVHLSNSDLEDVLQQVWVAGPGAANPGELLTSDTTPMTREQAQALAIDLSRRSTPAEGGFCTFQPVVDGGACPWNLDCHNCDKFVLSGADLLYWRRKREQWRQLAEGAPDDATADYLHRYFEPTARAIDGLERALAGLGLLDQALALDLRKPQDYFRRVWSTAFRATDLAEPPAPPTTKTARPPTTNRKPAHDRARPISTTHRRRAGGTAPRHPSRARPCPRRHRTAAPGEDTRQRRCRRPPRRRVPNVPLHQSGRENRCQPRRSARQPTNAADCSPRPTTAREASWRERALNAEDALKAANAEILAQRTRIGELLGRIRDLEAEWTQDAVQRITTENTTLKQRVRQLTTDNRTLDERLKAARSNLRFQDRRIADLEARLTEFQIRPKRQFSIRNGHNLFRK